MGMGCVPETPKYPKKLSIPLSLALCCLHFPCVANLRTWKSKPKHSQHSPDKPAGFLWEPFPNFVHVCNQGWWVGVRLHSTGLSEVQFRLTRNKISLLLILRAPLENSTWLGLLGCFETCSTSSNLFIPHVSNTVINWRAVQCIFQVMLKFLSPSATIQQWL